MTYFTARPNFVTLAFTLVKVDFSETVAACDLNVGK